MTQFTIATWNVNSLRVRLPHLGDWLAANPVDVVALQETKLPDSDFPATDIAALGYESACSGQRTYNGVAILSRRRPDDVLRGLPGEGQDAQRRVIGASFGDLLLLNLFPRGDSLSG